MFTCEVSFGLADFFITKASSSVRHAKVRAHGACGSAGCTDGRVCRGRLSCRADHRDLWAGRGARGLLQGGGRWAGCIVLSRRNKQPAMSAYFVSLPMGVAMSWLTALAWASRYCGTGGPPSAAYRTPGAVAVDPRENSNSAKKTPQTEPSVAERTGDRASESRP
jgi:hypothetical protein